MIRKYRNRAGMRLCGGLAMLGTGALAAWITSNAKFYGGSFADKGIFTGVVLGIIGYLFFVFGCADLLKAKGYATSLMLAFILPVLGCCLIIPMLLFFIWPLALFVPPVVFFGLKDLTKRRF